MAPALLLLALLPAEPSPREALAGFHDLIGSWKGTGTPAAGSREDRDRGFWVETIRWQWQFKGKDAWLLGEVEKGKHFARFELRHRAKSDDFELLATTAYMLGRDDDLSFLERAYHVYLDDGEALRAAHCAGWVGMHLFTRGEMGRATGWLGRAQRLVEREGRDCVERGYLLFPLMFRHEAAGDYGAAAATAAEAAEIGEVRTEPPGMVLVETAFGGRRVMDLLAGDPLPRIC